LIDVLSSITGTPNNAALELMMNMFGGLGAGSLSVPNNNNPDG
jgi:ubiquilin